MNTEQSSKEIKKLISYSEGGITSKVIVKTQKTSVTLFCMAKGTSLSEHTSTREAIVFVLEGKGIFTLKGRKIPMAEGVMIHMESDAVHALDADENMSFLPILH